MEAQQLAAVNDQRKIFEWRETNSAGEFTGKTVTVLDDGSVTGLGTGVLFSYHLARTQFTRALAKQAIEHGLLTAEQVPVEFRP